jgi:OOP family OmpA-OmpF porin
MKWRWEASRAGIPFGEYILQKTMQYRVEQAYLISRENGLLIGHVHHEASKIKDSDAVSAMFTAIQDFVKESFSPDRTGRLESADMGEFTLWAVHGPHALLVCVIRGVPPKSLRADLSAILERLHFRYGDAIRDYKGDTTSVPGIENDLGRCLRFEARRERLQKRGFARIGIVALILLLAVAGYLLVRSWNSDRDFARLHDALANSPGIHVTELRRDGDSYALSGLRDPLAEPVSDIVASADIDPRLVAARMQPFQSLLPELVEARARQRLAPPPTARIVVEGTTLRVSGAAPAAWHRQLEQRYAMLSGIAALDSSALEVNDRPDIQGALERLDGHRFFFASGVELGSESAARIADHGQALRELAAMASADGQRFEVTLVGSTDSVGGNAMNEELARKRTEIVAQRLASYDLVISRQRQLLTPGLDEEPSVDPERRYVQVDIRLLDAPAQQ